MTVAERIGWLLTLEPVGGSGVAWSLLRVGDAAVSGPVAAGLLPGVATPRDAAAAVLPGTDTTSPDGSGSLWSSPLAHVEQERQCAVTLGQALLPAALRYELLSEAASAGARLHTVTIACRGWLARVPWDALALDDIGDCRLIERATVLAGLSPTLLAGRALTAQLRPGAPALRILDPGPRGDQRLLPIYPGGYPDSWDDDGVLRADEELLPDGAPYSAHDFGETLRRPGGWSRLLYLGHALSGTRDTPAAAALVFSAGAQRDGLTAHSWLTAPETWPAPAKVALIACSSDDALHIEQAGLPVAAINAGAQLLTVTRWVLPTDVDPPRETATTDLALAVDAAHQSDRPISAVRSWQREQLAQWRATGHRRHAPLLWASLATYVAAGESLAES